MELALSPEELESLYRFALLLTGSESRAGEAVLDACSQCAAQLDSYRNAAGRTVCLLTHVRESCLKKQPSSVVEAASDPVRGGNVPLTVQISTLPEPERSALALFYAARLTTREIASLLKISIEEFSDRLESAREHLRKTGSLSVPVKAEAV